MTCAWRSLLGILPVRFRSEVDRLGKIRLQELHLRMNAPPELVLEDRVHWLEDNVSKSDLQFCVNAASHYSPWAASSIAQGFLTAPGGHRIGLCGEAVIQDGRMAGIREIHSLHIRIARDFPGIAEQNIRKHGSILVIGAPGWGKTTLLRDIARQIAETETVAVVDERGELFPEGFSRGKRMDVLLGCPKSLGIEMVLRTMGPAYIAVDEITAAEDSQALLQAAGCGVRLIATAHGSSLGDMENRSVYKSLLNEGVFQTVITLHPDKSYNTERMRI